MTGAEALREDWGLLETLGPEPESFRVQAVRGRADAGDPPLLGIDDEGHRLLLIPVRAAVNVSEDRISSGVQIVELRLSHHQEERRFVAVRCKKSHLVELFSIMASEMLEVVDEQPDRPDLACRRVLNRWRELLERERGTGPTEAEIVAILGELICLREVLEKNPDALGRWVGPLRERHDFSAPGIRLEVKTSRALQGTHVIVHGVDQLEAPETGDLFLTVIKLERIAEEGVTLPGLVAEIQALGCDTVDFMQRLAMVGIEAATLPALVGQHYSLRERHMYVVDDQFPCITRSSFAGGDLPQGIVSLEYVVDLTGASPAPLSERASSEVFDRLAFA